jgi:hypothetical protein
MDLDACGDVLSIAVHWTVMLQRVVLKSKNYTKLKRS